MNAHIIYIFSLEHRTVAIYSEFGLKDRYFTRGPPWRLTYVLKLQPLTAKATTARSSFIQFYRVHSFCSNNFPNGCIPSYWFICCPNLKFCCQMFQFPQLLSTVSVRFTVQTMAPVVSTVISFPHMSHPGKNLHFNAARLATLQRFVKSLLLVTNGISDFDELQQSLNQFLQRVQVLEQQERLARILLWKKFWCLRVMLDRMVSYSVHQSS